MQMYFSRWSLALKDKEIKTAYEAKTFQRYNKCNPVILTLLTILSSSLFIVLACNTKRYQENERTMMEFYGNYTVCSFVTLFNLSLLTVILRCPTIKLQRFITHYISICIFILYVSLRFLLFYNKTNDIVCFSLTTLEFCYRFLFIVLGIMNFVDLIINCIIVLVFHITLFVISLQYYTISMVNSYTYYVFLIMTITLSYFFHRKDMISFCYEFKLKESCEWHIKMLNSANAGVIKIANNKASYINKKAEELLLKNEQVKEIASNSDYMINDEEAETINLVKLINQNINLFLNALLDCSVQIKTSEERDRAMSKPLEFLKEKYLAENKKDFFYLGHKTFYFQQIDSNLNNIEDKITIAILYSYQLEKDSEDNFEFILNDVSTTKKRTEFQYRSLFLSKIAHEFKNPLITIGELSEKISESITLPEQKENISLIKSLSLYMYSLSRDLECFSQMQINTNTNLSITSIDLEETILFVKSISLGLLARYQKQDKVKLDIIVDEKLPKTISSDEVKLRQILINLISNSIKFTNEGSITLTFDKIDNEILVSVVDTGIGMDEEAQRKLFIPFENMIDNNPTGVGLGLCIVKELSSKLGSQITFKSIPNKGSSFSFKLPLSSSENVTNDHNHLNQSLSHLHATTGEDNDSLLTNKTLNKTVELSHIKLYIPISPFKKRKINVLIADDESIIRQSSIRILTKFAQKNNLLMNITEVEDGFELLYKVTSTYNTVNSIDLIICDENMTYCNGYECLSQLSRLVQLNKMYPIDFYILSATDHGDNHDNENKMKVTAFSKPLNEEKVIVMLQGMFLNK